MQKNDLKVVGKQILYWNGVKWLVKETCPTNEIALIRMQEILSNA